MIDPIETIRSLIAKSKDRAVGEAEAAVFAAKVAKLMDKHNLTEKDLGEKREEITATEYCPKYVDPWRRSIVMETARLYDCRAINSETHRYVKSRKTGREKLVSEKSFVIVGRPAKAAVAQMMCDYFIETVVRLAHDYSSERKAILGFARGCGERLADRIWEIQFSRTHPETENDETSSTEIAVRTESKEVVDWIDKNMDLIWPEYRGSDLSGLHSANGSEAAEGISIVDQVNQSTGTRLLS